MAYHHILVRHEDSPTRYSLLFKDLSEQELLTPFMMRFVRKSQGKPEADQAYASQIWASIVRTERTHDEAVTSYLRDWGEKAEEFMRTSGYPVNSQPMGNFAILGAGEDVTDEFLRKSATPKRKAELETATPKSREENEEARRRIEILATNTIPLGKLARMLAQMDSPPNHRRVALTGDRRDRHYDAWFDGGAIVTPTGGPTEYWFDDGARATMPELSPRLGVEIEWPDGRAVSIKQGADLRGFVEYVPVPAKRYVPRNPGFDPIADQIRLGMMVRYESGDPRRDGKVSVKTLNKNTLHHVSMGQKFRRFRREVCASRRVAHANIVRVLYAGEDGDVIFLGTEHIDGRPLLGFFEANERFGVGEAVILMGELCAALHAAHEAGIVHCSVTPATVMINAEGHVKLGDFGYARFDGADAAENEPEPDPGTTSEMIGSPAYISPEAISGATLDRRTDIFSAGAILYQLLTGQQAFAGPGALTTARQVLQEDPQFPSLIDNAISQHFDEVVRKALAKDATDRYQTALELNVALQDAMCKSGPGKH